MRLRHFTALGLLALLIPAPAALRAEPAVAVAAPGNSASATRNRLVFQVTDEDSRKWNTILANVNNVQEELGQVEIAVVAIGPGLGMLLSLIHI